MSLKLRDLLKVLNDELDYEIFVDCEPVAIYDHEDYRLDWYLDLNVIEINYYGEEKPVAINLESKEEHEANLQIREVFELKADAFDILANNFDIEIEKFDSENFDIYITGHIDADGFGFESKATINSYDFISGIKVATVKKALDEVEK